MPPAVQSLDHLVLTATDMARTIAFYRDVLGMEAMQFTPADGTVRWALRFGTQKINLHQAGAEFLPKAMAPTPGSADLCFLSDTTLPVWLAHLNALGIPVTEGPVLRSGTNGPIMSIYLRDPDGNLIEVSNEIKDLS